MPLREKVRRVNFEWDPQKAVGNARKHGVSFEEAATAFISARLANSHERRTYQEDPGL